ncbi:helix-turn-helix domain-containing protein [Streptomyces caniscabiei]|uniref:Helix-turn-helix domain-containing protein n=1 Tax=Streptomyces caniscabiei TaxID=2746961 RepID=A0ABU4MLJ4_9ACTN|nr:helix-turn-helix domain-containing protein [Streptomyces caniscabiei]MBE4790963.1 helix-turn-helix domain-containing protein [Streptomyces caniscabiei]MDX3009590.1 helix-turn-helix domain-containing protein [Streptomyces caniscabiei]MDX3037235.1 helix-turn-helix domain-containing protein [Streptomyces caniscabiei]
MATKWTRLGEKLKTARIALGKEQQQIAAEIGIGRVAVGNIEKGRVSKLTPSIRSYAQIVGWTDDSPERVLAGGEPTLRNEGPQASTEALGVAPDLAIDVREALRRGPLLKSQVVEVETPAGKVLATIVLRGQEGMSAEELLASLRAVTVRVSADETGNQPKE